MTAVEYVSKVKRKADKPHWTPPRELCDNGGMSSRSSILNWLGLAILALLVVALILLSRGGERAAEPASAECSSPLAACASPLAVALTSPLLATQATAILSPSPTVVAAQATRSSAPSPTVPAPTTAAPASDLELTLVHSNDTWGYLAPCG